MKGVLATPLAEVRASGAALGSDEGDSEDAARMSTNMTIERQTPKRDFGD